MQVCREYFRDVSFDDARDFAHQLDLNQRLDAYLEQLIAAAGNDLSMVWQEAHNRLPDESSDELAADRATPVMV